MSTDQENPDLVEENPKRGAPSQFRVQFEQETQPEKKIRLSLDFMRAALLSQGTPHFRDFWEGRRLCLPLFKENIAPKQRSLLWGEYIELSAEGRRLKEILDEQSAFAVEQIELAVQALERDLEHYDLLLSQMPPVVFFEESIAIKDRISVYEALQRELNLLNTAAVRIHALRKEVMKTEMRIRTKNQLFQRLSHCGDKVFPRRKELIKTISHEFTQDVERFIQAHFQEGEEQKLPFYALREEIKALQSIAKILTLNTHAFTETRLKLSTCWDKIKQEEKEHKKEFIQKKQAFKQNFDAVLEKIRAFIALCQTEISVEEVNCQAKEIVDFMQTLELGREEAQSLRDEINRAKRPVFDRLRMQEQEKVRQAQESETRKREKIKSFKELLETLLSTADAQDPEQLTTQTAALSKEFETLTLSKAEKQVIERLFKTLRDVINEKKERLLMHLSEEDLASLEKLQELLQERKERRQEIKNQLEVYRKALGGSGFDFEKAMMYREMIEAEKATLEKIQASIAEIEEKIAEIEG